MLATTFDSYTKKHYAILGKLLIQKEPEVASKLISTYLKREPIDDDFSKIPAYFRAYCRVEGIDAKSITGQLYKKFKVDLRRKFIAVILHIYSPNIFLIPTDTYNYPKGLASQLGESLKLSRVEVSKVIKQVVVWQKSYEEFSNAVEDTLNKIIPRDGAGVSSSL